MKPVCQREYQIECQIDCNSQSINVSNHRALPSPLPCAPAQNVRILTSWLSLCTRSEKWQHVVLGPTGANGYRWTRAVFSFNFGTSPFVTWYMCQANKHVVPWGFPLMCFWIRIGFISKRNALWESLVFVSNLPGEHAVSLLETL